MNNEQQHQKDLERIKNFRLMDDDFMNACFDGNIEATEFMLRIILGRQDINVTKVTTQKIMKNLIGRDVWLDILATDDKNEEINIEIQRSDKGAGRKRARYHSSILDTHLLGVGDDFDKLPETYVIFLTENDVIGKNQPIYWIDRYIDGADLFNDGEHIIYVNGAIRGSKTELEKLMHDFFCTNPDDMYYEELAKKVRYFKEEEEGVRSMCKALEDMRTEVAREVAKETEWKTKVETIHRLLIKGFSVEDIAEGVDLTVEQVKEIAGQPA